MLDYSFMIVVRKYIENEVQSQKWTKIYIWFILKELTYVRTYEYYFLETVIITNSSSATKCLQGQPLGTDTK